MTRKDLKALQKLLDMAKTYKTANCQTLIDAERVILQLTENDVRSKPQTSDKDIHHCKHCGSDTMHEKSVSVTGIWLRFIEGKTQVLAEVEGKWRLLMEEPLDGNPTYSHIYEPSGIRTAPLDPLHDYELDTLKLIDSMQKDKCACCRGSGTMIEVGDCPDCGGIGEM